MTQEEKELLLKDLSARLPYKTRVYLKQSGGIQEEFSNLELKPEFIYSIGYCIIKPYLRPMSSMTEEEEKEYHKIVDGFLNSENAPRVVDWLNAHHFDYRIDPFTGKTLIESGLALKASEGMYKND